jgi:hypothetical protein
VFARVSTILGNPERVDEGIQNYKNTVVPAAKKLTGFKGTFLLVDRKKGQLEGITLWETENDLNASQVVANSLRNQGSQVMEGVYPPSVEIYEVAIQPKQY